MTKEEAVRFRSDVDLSPYNTMGVSAHASTFLNINSVKQLFALRESGFFEKKDPFILGGGSNILLTGDLSRPVLKISIMGVEMEHVDDETIRIHAGAGENWHDLVTWAVKKGFAGIENLALIPGTVGAAPIQNIGAYGVELESVFESLEFFNMKTGVYRSYKKEECQFSYRSSLFKKELKGEGIVTSISLLLKHNAHQVNISYQSLRDFLDKKNISNPDIKDIYEAVMEIRTSKLPDPGLIGNAGSFFKNPVVDMELFENLKTDYENVPNYPVNGEKVKIPAAWLIEQAGWKGKREGDVGTYENQALVIVNHGGAKGREILEFSNKIREAVRQKFDIELVPEVNLVE